ncbi:hypothetical protein [Flavobacterium sp.]|uniref:hypothetical protein n=1 Tax=Flavobacterium sp. TaxID=239 RepID=UPI003437B894
MAKIIAGEYNNPRSYNMCTPQTLKILGITELDLFQKACSLCIDNGVIPKTIFSILTDSHHIRSSLDKNSGGQFYQNWVVILNYN